MNNNQTSIPVKTNPSLHRQVKVGGVIENKDKEGYTAFMKARQDAKTIDDLSNRLNKLEQLFSNLTTTGGQ